MSAELLFFARFISAPHKYVICKQYVAPNYGLQILK